MCGSNQHGNPNVWHNFNSHKLRGVDCLISAYAEQRRGQQYSISKVYNLHRFWKRKKPHQSVRGQIMRNVLFSTRLKVVLYYDGWLKDMFIAHRSVLLPWCPGSDFPDTNTTQLSPNFYRILSFPKLRLWYCELQLVPVLRKHSLYRGYGESKCWLWRQLTCKF